MLLRSPTLSMPTVGVVRRDLCPGKATGAHCRDIMAKCSEGLPKACGGDGEEVRQGGQE